MKFKTAYILLFFISLSVLVYSQPETYNIAKASFSSEIYDEYCPVYYKNWIVFCSNRTLKQVKKYSNSQDKGFFKIVYVDTAANARWQDAGLFSKTLKTNLNDGPATFSQDGSTIYYSRNIVTEGKESEISRPRNKLGIFFSSFDGVEWNEPRDIRFNNEWYNITTPCLSADGERLYFASDKPGGFGGSDLYYCPREKDFWGEPVNLGSTINTSGNEAYPFVNSIGELFFSSDSLPGLGGKDIFYSRCIDTVWQTPVHIDPPINSKYDDFGILTDQIMKAGYFSSNRSGSLDIFTFKTNFPQFFFCEEQKSDLFCFRFEDEGDIDIDYNNIVVEWSFGDGFNAPGEKVDHCFPGPGKYSVTENLLDKKSGKRILEKQSFELDIIRIEQPFITCNEVALAGDNLSFDGLKSNMPGYVIIDYYWEFGDGAKDTGSNVKHSYKKAGDYKVKLGLLLRNSSSGELKQYSVFKQVRISSSESEMSLYLSRADNSQKSMPLVNDYPHLIKNNSSVTTDGLKDNKVFQIELLSSQKPIDKNDNVFKSIRNNYYVNEVFLPVTNSYSYIVAEETDFKDAYMIYKNVVSLGIKDAFIRTKPHITPEEKELIILETVYGSSAEVFFLKGDSRLSSNGYAYMDQIASLMSKYPDISLLIESHTDKAGSPAMDLQLTKQRAQSIANYLVDRGVDYKRLISVGRGSLRPLASNNSEEEKKKNQRIDIMIINNER